MATQDKAGLAFSDLDRQTADLQATVINVLDQLAASPIIREVREIAREALALRPGDRVLDAGSGAGEVARDLATLVGPDGEVTAMDSAVAAVEAARARHDGGPVRYVAGDITAMEFPDATFDAVRSERVLQHLSDPEAAVSELMRVLRPGGRVALIDTDWESFLGDGYPQGLLADLERRVQEAGQMRLGQRSSGRLLRGRLIRAGAVDVMVRPVTMAMTELSMVRVIHPAFSPDAMRKAGFLTEDVLAPWFDAIESAAARGELLTVITIWVAAGVKPGY